MSGFHAQLSQDHWSTFSLSEQLGNIGSEVGRAMGYQKTDTARFFAAAERALELFDLTLSDSRWRSRLHELNRAREIFCDTVWNDSREYSDSLEELDRYFFDFALAARRAVS